MRVFVVDTTRGAREGDELDKVLAFFPAGLNAEAQQQSAGLVEALASLVSIFTGSGTMGGARGCSQRHAVHAAEAGLWFGLTVPADAFPVVEWRHASLVSVLAECHGLCCLMHGRLRELLAADPTGSAARVALQPLIADLGTRLLAGSVSCGPLSHEGSLPQLNLDRATELATRTAVAPALDGATHVVVFYRESLVWSSIPPEDAQSLCRYAARCLLPKALRSGLHPSQEGAPFRVWRMDAHGFLQPVLEQCPSVWLKTNGSGLEVFGIIPFACDGLTLLFLHGGNAADVNLMLRKKVLDVIGVFCLFYTGGSCIS